MRFKPYMDMAIALKSKAAYIIKTGRDFMSKISTGLLLFGDFPQITSAPCGST